MELEFDDFNAAIALAAFTAFLGLFGWICNQIWTWISGYLRRERERRATYILFYTAITIRLQNTKANFGEVDKESYLRLVQESGRSFKAYIAQGPENADFSMIEAYYPDMSTKLRFLIKSLVSYDQLFDAMYRKVGTDEFAALSKARKASVVEQLFTTANDVIHIAEKVKAEMEWSIPEIRQISTQIGALIAELETKLR